MSDYIKQPIDPNDTQVYTIDWSQWLPAGDAIATSDWTVVGATKVGQSIIEETTNVKINGATPGGIVQLTNRITTLVSGEQRDWTLFVNCQEQ